jgi:PRTRC genetic system protein B
MKQMNVANLMPPSSDETAALLFLCGDQYLFRYRAKDNTVAYKFVSSAAVRAAFAEETIETNWLPDNTRRWGIGKRGEWIVITYPPQKHRFTFVSDDHETKTLTLEIPMPALAFLGYEQRYYLWAFKEDVLSGNTNLYTVPLPNVDANGVICFGSNLVPKASARTIEEACRLFLASPFTNHSTNGKSRKCPNDVREQLLQLANARRRSYPLNDLVSLNRTANAVIEWTLGSRGME